MILAASQAKTPLAIASGPVLGIVFANDAFAALLGSEPDALVGRRLASLGTATVEQPASGGFTRLELTDAHGRVVPVALSTAAVAGPDGSTACWLCSLIDARGDDADEALAREAALLKEVAQAAGELMCESAAASDSTKPASEIAFDAIAHVTRHTAEERA